MPKVKYDHLVISDTRPITEAAIGDWVLVASSKPKRDWSPAIIQNPVLGDADQPDNVRVTWLECGNSTLLISRTSVAHIERPTLISGPLASVVDAEIQRRQDAEIEQMAELIRRYPMQAAEIVEAS